MTGPIDNGSDRPGSRRPATPGLQVFVSPKEPLALGEAEGGRSGIGDSQDLNRDYEHACEQVRQENERLLDAFVALLRRQRLAPRTIKRHRDNVEFFLNEFLLYESVQTPGEGIGEVDAFLGDWFIRKAMWSTPSAIKSNATSLYKFYAFLAALDRVTPEQLAALSQTIVRQMPVWRAMCERYNDPDIEDWQGMD